MYFICCYLYDSVYTDAAAVWLVLAAECARGICRSSAAYTVFFSHCLVSFSAIGNSLRPVHVSRPSESTSL